MTDIAILFHQKPISPKPNLDFKIEGHISQAIITQVYKRW